MLKLLHIKGYKSLADAEAELEPLVALFAPSASTKTNFLDRFQLASKLETSRRPATYSNLGTAPRRSSTSTQRRPLSIVAPPDPMSVCTRGGSRQRSRGRIHVENTLR